MKTAAAIDIGSNAVRMTIARRDSRGQPRALATDREALRLGHDVFSKGRIRPGSLQDLARALARFSRLMRRHKTDMVRCVGTSALREAANSRAVVASIQRRVGLAIEAISGAEEARLIRLAVARRVDLRRMPSSLLVELGGGSVEICLLDHGDLKFEETLKAGAVRLLELLKDGGAPARFEQAVVQDRGHILNRLKKHLPTAKAGRLIGTGGNIEELARLALRYARDECRFEDGVARMPIRALNRVLKILEQYSTQGRVENLNLRPDRADVILPAGLFYRELAKTLSLREIIVPFSTLREGILLELFASHLPGEYSPELHDQIFQAASQYASRFRLELRHAGQVRRLSLILFDSLTRLHGLGGPERLYLELAAYLHDVGYFIASDAHHKHSQYLISIMEFPGLDKDQVALVSQVARYHRKALPGLKHPGYAALKPGERRTVCKLAALLRLADSLDRANKSGVKTLETVEREKSVELRCQGGGAMQLERWAIRKKSDLFRKVYGKNVVVRASA